MCFVSKIRIREVAFVKVVQLNGVRREKVLISCPELQTWKKDTEPILFMLLCENAFVNITVSFKFIFIIHLKYVHGLNLIISN